MVWMCILYVMCFHPYHSFASVFVFFFLCFLFEENILIVLWFDLLFIAVKKTEGWNGVGLRNLGKDGQASSPWQPIPYLFLPAYVSFFYVWFSCIQHHILWIYSSCLTYYIFLPLHVLLTEKSETRLFYPDFFLLRYKKGLKDVF